MSSLSKNEKKLRALNKKIRNSKPKFGEWNMNKIKILEKERDIMEKIVFEENIRKDKKEKFKNMNSEEAIEYFKCENSNLIHQKTEHQIPNTRHTRRLRKKVIQNLNDKILSDIMERKIRLRLNIINQIKNDLQMEEEKTNEFNNIKLEINNHFTS